MKKIKTWLHKKRKLLILGVLSFPVWGTFGVLAIDWGTSYQARNRVYENAVDVPYRRVGLVLGTSQYTDNGQRNLYFAYRINAAADLWHRSRVSYLIVSGDNSRVEYDETTDMKNALIAKGVKEEFIVEDYAGFRTLDSIVRAKKVFGQDEITVISQPFHNERAIFLGRAFGIDVIALNAQQVYGGIRYKVLLREKLARVKMVLDAVTRKSPKFLGEEIEIY